MQAAFALIALATLALALYTGYWGGLPDALQRGLYFAVAFPLVFLSRPLRAGRGGTAVRVLGDFVPAAAAVLVGLYFAREYSNLVVRVMFGFTALDYVVAAAALVLVVEGARRSIGWALPVLAGVFVLYARFGRFLPDPWGHSGFDMARIVSHLSLTLEGVFGIPFGAAATYVLVFGFFGAFLEATGAGDFIMNAANRLVGRFRGGPAKVAVVASAMFGTISGSAVANVAGTGSITIPTMKRTGYDPDYAAAVEAAASTGGQLMPPIMGAAAFIMAEILGVPYATVAAAAAIPAVLYFLGCFIAVDLEAARKNLRGLQAVEQEGGRGALASGWPYLVPLAVLVLLLFYWQWSALRAAFVSLLVLVAVAVLTDRRRLGERLWEGVRRGAASGVEAAAATACAGIVVGVFGLTGLGLKLSGLLVGLSGGNLTVLLLLVAAACLVLGMGVPTTAAYIMVAVMVAPALVELGLPPIAAHLFVFYYAIMSVVTPPVAVASYVAAGIAGSNPWRTGFTGLRLALPGLIVPFVMVYRPGLLGHAEPAVVLQTTLAGVAAVVCLGAALAGFGRRPLGGLERLLGVVAAVALLWPGVWSDAAGFGLAALFAWRAWGRRWVPAARQAVVSKG